MLTVLLAVVELAYPLLTGCFWAFEVVVLPLLPQAATASELNAASKPYVALKDLIRDICCSCHW